MGALEAALLPVVTELSPGVIVCLETAVPFDDEITEGDVGDVAPFEAYESDVVDTDSPLDTECAVLPVR